MSTSGEDGAAAVEWVASYLERRRAPRALAGRAGRHPRSASPVASERARAVRGGAPRPRRGAPAGAHALAEPPLLRVLRNDRNGARCPRRAPDRRPQPGRDPLAHVSCTAGARGGDARLARAAPRPARGLSRPHRGHGFDRRALRARGRSRAAPRPPRRPLLRACALGRRQGREAARARAAQGAGRRRVPAAVGAPRARRCVRGDRDDRDDRRRGDRPDSCDRRRVQRGRCLAPCRRGLRRARRRSAPSSARSSRAGSVRTRSA